MKLEYIKFLRIYSKLNSCFHKVLINCDKGAVHDPIPR